MPIIEFLQQYSAFMLCLVFFILIYVAVKKINLPGNNFVLAILSLLLSIILVSSQELVNFLLQVMPMLTLIVGVGFLVMLVLAFIMKDITTFAKPLAWIGFVLAILIILCVSFNSFPIINHLLPETSDSGLSQGLSEFKHYVFHSEFKDGFLFILAFVIVCFFLFKKS